MTTSFHCGVLTIFLLFWLFSWETILRTENKQSKVFIAVSQYRTETLRKKLIDLQSQRARERKKGRLPSRPAFEEQTLDDQKKLKGFVLDKIADGIRLDADKDVVSDVK